MKTTRSPLPEVADLVVGLEKTGWSYTYDGSVMALSKNSYTITADGTWKHVHVPGTVLKESVKTLEEMLETIHTFVYAIEHGLVDVAQRWTNAEDRIARTRWSIQLLQDQDSLEMLERVAETVTNASTRER